MITGVQVSKTELGGLIEIYRNDKFIGYLEYGASYPDGWVSFRTLDGRHDAMYLEIGPWLSRSLDYRREAIERFINRCYPRPTCPMTP